jgi:Haem-binding domain
MKIFKRVLLALAIILVLIQVVRPAKTNPPVDESRTVQAVTQMPPDVQAVVERSCNDCHSHKTRWPWYSEVAPVSWYLAHEVNEGRRELVFSDWAKYDARRAAHKLEEICDQVEQGKMPPKLYLLLHSDAKLSDSDKQLLCEWAKRERQRVIGANPPTQP